MDIQIMPIFFDNLSYFLKATVVTVYLSLISLFFGTLIGIFFGVLSVIGARVSKIIVACYIYVIRGIPILVLLFIAYFAFPAAGISISNISGALWVLSLWTGAYMTEIFRGAILTVPKGQTDAASSLGMKRSLLMKTVVLPQAYRYAVPPCVNMAIRLIKATSLVSIISIWELTYAGREIVEQTLTPFQIFGGIAIIYFLLCYSLSILGSRLEKKYTYVH